MLTAILLVCALVLGWLLGCGGLAPRGIGSRAGLDRRLRWVQRHPAAVNTGDIERVLLRHGLAFTDARLVTNRAFALGIRPFAMWMWIQAYGARELAVAVAGDLSSEELLDHLGQGTLPDFHELEVLAALNGLEAATGRGSARRRPGPQTRAADSNHTAEPRRLPPGWDSFFDDLAS